MPAIAILIGWWLYRTGPEVQPTEEKRAPKLVRTISLVPADYEIRVTAYGSVIPAQRVEIEPQVSGVVIRLHPEMVPGGTVRAGEELFALDPRLTELDLAVAQAEVVRAEAVLAEAERKWEEGRRLVRESVIPVTEVAALESAVRIQAAELERLRVRVAREEELLFRHVVRAPFNAVVLAETVDLGQKLDPGDRAVTLAGTDEFWVQVSLPTDQLRWIQAARGDQAGAMAEVFLDFGNDQVSRYTGEVIQLLSDLEEEGRMARALIRVVDPLESEGGRSAESLLLGSYVRVEIAAGELLNVVALDRPALREGNRIWVVDSADRLQIRDVTVRWREGEVVYIDPVFEVGERLVVSDLRVALPDMLVEAQDLESERPEPTAARVP